MNPDCPLTKNEIPITKDVLDVHHKKEVHSFPETATVQQINHPENALVLCVYCHKKHHSNTT
jgi:hypothetical protein